MDNDNLSRALKWLQLPDAELLAGPDEQRLIDVGNALAAEFRAPKSAPDSPPPAPVELLALAAPQRVAGLAAGASLPVLLARRETGLRRWQVHSDQNLWLLLSDLERGELAVRRPFHGDKRMRTLPPSGSGEPPEPVQARGVATRVDPIEIPDAAPAAGRHARLAVTALIHDRRSNTALVEVRGGPLPALAARAPTTDLLTLADGAAPLTADAVALHARPAAQGPTAIVEVQVRLPMATLPMAPSAGTREQSLALAHLLLLPLDGLDAIQLELAVPLQLDLRDPRRPRAEVQFAVDLRRHAPAALDGRHQAWLVIGDRIAGPVALR